MGDFKFGTWYEISSAPRNRTIVILTCGGHVEPGYFDADSKDEWKWKFWCTWGKGNIQDNAWRDGERALRKVKIALESDPAIGQELQKLSTIGQMP